MFLSRFFIVKWWNRRTPIQPEIAMRGSDNEFARVTLNVEITAIARRFAATNISVIIDKLKVPVIEMRQQEKFCMDAWPEILVRVCLHE
jgi:hypothetical protein